ncbi:MULTISPECIES: rhomboid family intramembrane serine protease [Bacillus]|uniref:Rhomboid protease GluP n=1 Tax=Bacillus capparidis TaxID=1840411 RepID=A0ABS4CUA8_9BACI|nr:MULTISPECIES: rhomboid family intramembrane serine protease [Bacillus]MBP1080669.1 rhomboid protease GluP [Bacillus capparidis]MED1094525.1 rhomboid family intramembrane serine protease [Bacillus capparidis]
MYSFQNVYWNLVLKLIEKQYDLVSMSLDTEEIWLQPSYNSSFDFIRFNRRDVDFSQEVERETEIQMQKLEQLRMRINKKSIRLLNVHFTAQPPVNDRNDIPFSVSETKNVEVVTFLVHPLSLQENAERLGSALNISFGPLDPSYEAVTYDQVMDTRNQVMQTAKHKEAERSKQAEMFQYGKPYVTYFFAGVQVLLFILLEAAGGSTNTQTLIEFGAKENSLLAAGEWWRLITPIVLHIGMTHLLFNTVALISVGGTAERIYGSGRFLFIYLAAGIFGSIGSFLFSPFPSAGASGAIFGCMGALLYLVFQNRQLFFKSIGMNILVLIGINAGIGFFVPNIDNAGHFGGLIGGFLAAAAVGMPKRTNLPLQGAAFLIAVILGAGAFLYGIYTY